MKNIAETTNAVENCLRQIARALRQPVEAEISRGKLTAAQRGAMRALAHHPAGLSLKDLSQEVGLSHSTVSGIVDRLESRGVIVRAVDPHDRRRTVITVSKEVREYIRTTLPTLSAKPLSAALRKMRAPDRAALLRRLEQLRDLLGD